MTLEHEAQARAHPGLAGTAVELPLTWEVSRHARRLFNLALAGLALAVVARRPEFVAAATPALVLLCAPRRDRPQSLHVNVRPSAARVYEGEQVALEVTISGNEGHEVELVLHAPDGVLVLTTATRVTSDATVMSYEMSRWGRRAPGFLEVAVWDRYRVHECHSLVRLPEVTCYPLPAVHRRALVLGRLSARSGDHPARSAGEGVEFAGVREYVAGDRQRSINWAATTRRGRLQVNTFAAERSQDLVVVVDTTSDVGELGSSPVDHALRGALGVARTYLDARDRVGMVFLGERMRWLPPGLGDRQFFRMMETLVEGRSGWSSGDDMTRLPRAALPPGAAVIVFSPLLDTKFVATLTDLRGRNFSVLVVDVLSIEPEGLRGKMPRLAQRIWQMERQALRFSLSQLGISVVRWDGREELVLPVNPRAAPRPRGRP